MEHERSSLDASGVMQSTPQSTPGMKYGGEGSLAPKLLNFSTPRSSRKAKNVATPPTPSTPGTFQSISDVESLSSTGTTPEMSKLSLGRGRGRPRKPVVKPTFEDYPVDGTLEEQKIYQKQRTTKLWRYNKLSGSNSAEFRKSENTRVKKYHKTIKQEDPVVEESSDTSSSSEHKKKLSRER